jgi:hypothetical protein
MHYLRLVTLFGLLAATIGIAVYMQDAPQNPDIPPNPPSNVETPVPETPIENLLREKATTHLAAADKAAGAALEKRLYAVWVAFEGAHQGASSFAEDATSWSARWASLKDTVGIEDDAHKKFLAESFEKNVFSNDTLKTVLEGVVAGYINDLKEIEGRMLVSLRADIADSALAGRLSADLQSDEAFREAYDRLTVQLDDTLTKENRVFLASNAASWLAMDLATPIALRLLISAAGALGVHPATLSSGGGYFVATLAVGAVVGVIADYIIAAVLKYVAGYDPVADVVTAVRSSLDTLEAGILGDPEKPGLKEELNRISRERAAIRRKAVLGLFSQGGDK